MVKMQSRFAVQEGEAVLRQIDKRKAKGRDGSGKGRGFADSNPPLDFRTIAYIQWCYINTKGCLPEAQNAISWIYFNVNIAQIESIRILNNWLNKWHERD